MRMNDVLDLLLRSPEALDHTVFLAESAHEYSPLDNLVSLAEAMQMTLRVADGLEVASAPLGASPRREDLLVFRIGASKHRHPDRQMFLQMTVNTSKDGGTDSVFHTVGAVLYLTSEPHYCPNHVPEDLKGKIREILSQESSTRLATFSTSVSGSQSLRGLLPSVVENLLAGVRVPVP